MMQPGDGGEFGTRDPRWEGKEGRKKPVKAWLPEASLEEVAL